MVAGPFYPEGWVIRPKWVLTGFTVVATVYNNIYVTKVASLLRYISYLLCGPITFCSCMYITKYLRKLLRWALFPITTLLHVKSKLYLHITSKSAHTKISYGTCETKSIQLLGASPQDPLTRGSASRPSWGTAPIPPVSPPKLAVPPPI